ncbi:MAG TPA: hypothetical protein VKB71_06385 [Rhizomicrobium sp.]|nr:hypothetical protein [Rhizomicrobium sp.]
MDFALTPEQEAIQKAVAQICARFDTPTGWSTTDTAAFRRSCTRRSPPTAGSASPSRKLTAAQGSASRKPR